MTGEATFAISPARKTPYRLRRLEYLAFSANLPAALAHLQSCTVIDYASVLETHRILFCAVYPWAGQDRMATAPNIAIAKGGIPDLFAHPRDIGRAAQYALGMAGIRRGSGPDRERVSAPSPTRIPFSTRTGGPS